MTVARRDWVIWNEDYQQFWGPDRGGYFGLWGAGLYTEEEAKALSHNTDRKDRPRRLSEYRDQVENMRGAFERLSLALEASTFDEPTLHRLVGDVRAVERFKSRAHATAILAGNVLNLDAHGVLYVEGAVVRAMVAAWVSAKSVRREDALREIAAATMLAQSNPDASAAAYRAALVDACNVAIAALSEP